MDKTQLQSLRAVIDYLYEDEKRDYESLGDDSAEQDAHIFPHIQALKTWLDAQGKTVITLSGFGNFSDNEDGLTELKKCADKHGVACREGYYDYELVGDRESIEAVTKEMYSMPADQWAENALTETIL